MRTIQLLAILVMIFAPTALLNSEGDADQFTFVRLRYGGQLTRRSSWRVDWPASDRNFIWQLRKQTNIDTAPREKIIEVGAAELFDYPFAYMLEVGSLRLSWSEAENLREYLLRGGFIVIDDFHGQREWRRFYTEFKKIFPEREPVDIPISHPFSDASLKSMSSFRFRDSVRFSVDAHTNAPTAILLIVVASMMTEVAS